MRSSIILLTLPLLLLPSLPVSGEEAPSSETTQNPTPAPSEEELSRQAIAEEECGQEKEALP